MLAVAVTVTGCGRYSQNHRAAGERQFTAGRYQEAIAEFDKAVRFSPNDPRTIRQLGLAHFRLGQLGEAQVLLERAEELVPDDPDAQLSLADIYLAQRNADAAARQLNSVLSKHPDNIDGLA
ncbi:MAG: tetratricopeptide repeat protein, partial [Gemmatimonadota bacterium]|nr:tetratricopeptide repeat protein [Gemmatimonadota bacterium]